MARFIFNQVVKHGVNVYSEGDVSTVDDDIATYFASNGWGYIEGEDTVKREPILDPGLEPEPSKDIVLEVHNAVIGTEDSNNG